MGSGSSMSRPVSRQTTSLSQFLDSPEPEADNDEQSSEEPEAESGDGIVDVKSQSSHQPRDLMISYSHADKEMMSRIREKLEENGISVWVDVVGLNAGVDFLSKIGQAIIDAKLFVFMMSTASLTSRYCRDELALAYVTNTAIFPITLVSRDQLDPLMDTGMKLQLANYQWTQLDDPDSFDSTMEEMIDKMKEILEDHDEESDEDHPEAEGPHVHRIDLNRHKSRTDLLSDVNTTRGIMPEQFWSMKFREEENVHWERFVDSFFDLYKDYLDATYSSNDQDWLVRILHREMEVEDDEILSKANFIAFCTVEEKQYPLWRRVQDQACESLAMKEVFNMDSSVRVDAIENLGRFRSLGVIDALRDLLTDPDANVRAVAAISLARTEANDRRTVKHVMATLNDKDRLVREAGCLALGHIQAKTAVKRLLHMWRNDVMSHVREAASVALKQIGGEEVTKAMHVTTVLAEEIRELTSE